MNGDGIAQDGEVNERCWRQTQQFTVLITRVGQAADLRSAGGKGPPVPHRVGDSANWQTGGLPHGGRNENRNWETVKR